MKKRGRIILERKIPELSRELAPISGSRGHCRLCGCYTSLSNSHILPQSVGNKGRWLADGYLSLLEGKQHEYRKRHFRNDISFKTTCQSCNSALGHNEDIELYKLYNTITDLCNSKLMLPKILPIRLCINKILKGVLYYTATANDRCPPTPTDKLALEVHEGAKHIGEVPFFFLCVDLPWKQPLFDPRLSLWELSKP